MICGLSPISWARKFDSILILGLTPQALCFRLLRRLMRTFRKSLPQSGRPVAVFRELRYSAA